MVYPILKGRSGPLLDLAFPHSLCSRARPSAAGEEARTQNGVGS